MLSNAKNTRGGVKREWWLHAYKVALWNFPVHDAHRAAGEKAFIAPVDPGAPARIRYGQGEQKQKRRA